jgi:polyphosphate kinase
VTTAVENVFNYLTAETEAETYDPLLVAPITLADRVIELIGREAQNAKAGKPASIIAKMNGLIDRRTVEALYAASQAGVEIDLIVRGMCSLRPGVKGLSERIRVRSIVGRLLEHSRIFCFSNAGEDEIYCGSADWMPRNLVERCEVLFPVTQPDLKKRLRDEILQAYLDDNVKARLLQPDGEYIRAPDMGTPFSAQVYLIALAEHTDDRNACS